MSDDKLVFAYEEPVPIAIFAARLKPPRTPDALRKWRTKGIKWANSEIRIKCNMSKLPSGGWAVSQKQYDEFVAALNKGI